MGAFYRHVMDIGWELLPVPPTEVVESYRKYVAGKDAHVLAAAVEGGSQFLLTLDRRHLLAEAVIQSGPPIVVLRPGDFIQQYYPRHQDYPRLPGARLT